VLKASAPARIVNVSSSGQAFGRIDFADLQGAQKYNSTKAHNQSKLAQIYFTYELADQLNGIGVTVNALHTITGIDAEKGAQTTLYVATSPEIDGVSGKYFSQGKQGKETPSSHLSYDVAIRRRLWDISQDLLRQSALFHTILEN
jgi:NAD(P)-dependent dehydrogenase (short-subunit alcohol dehydrogenase family)